MARVPTQLNPPMQRQLTQMGRFVSNWIVTIVHHCNRIPVPRSSPQSRRSAMHSGMVRKILVSRQHHGLTSKVRLVPQWHQAQMRPFLSTRIATTVHRNNWTTDPHSSPQSQHAMRSGVPRRIVLSRQRHSLVLQVHLVPILQPPKNTPRLTMHNRPSVVET